MVNKMTAIESRIMSDYELLISEGYEVVGVFLHGSQNYGLAHEGSDIDTVAVVVPTLREVAKNSRPVSHEKVLPSGEHICIKDIRLFCECLLKQNPSFVELIFTEDYYINLKYRSIFNSILEKAEEIAHYDEIRAIKTMVGQALEAYHKLCTCTEESKVLFSPGKKLSVMLRLEHFMYNYAWGADYMTCLRPVGYFRDYLIKLKTSDMTIVDALAEAEKCKAGIDVFYDRYIKTHTKHEVDESIPALLESVTYDIFHKSLESDFT